MYNPVPFKGNYSFFAMSDQYTFDDHEGSIRLRFAWEQVVRAYLTEIPKGTVQKFISPLKPVSFENGKVELHAPGQFIAEWVNDKFLNRLQESLGDELGEPITVSIRVMPRLKEDTSSRDIFFTETTTYSDAEKFIPTLKYRFDSFVVGQSNRMAYAGATAVAENPGTKYNPLFIYGASGLGKTHLLHAIAHTVLRNDPKLSIHYISAQTFAEQFVQALQNNRIDQFRKSQRNVGIWLIDDIQFIAGKEKTQEEIFHTFNYLHQLQKQVVICSDRSPRELYLLDDRLRSRFESGLVVDIQHPDTETRAAILLSKANQEQIKLSSDVALFIAERIDSNVRFLEGVLTKIAVFASLEGSPITQEIAQTMIEAYYENVAQAKVGIPQIVEAVARYYKIPGDEIKGESRKAPITHARHVAVFLARDLTGNSWKHIGSHFGGRDHSSVMHAYDKISELMITDKELASSIRHLKGNLAPKV